MKPGSSFIPATRKHAVRSCKATTIALATAACMGLLGAPGDARAEQVSAVEFFHTEFEHFFLGTSPAEIASLDGGLIAGWKRGWIEFKVHDAPGPGLVPVCRFFTASFAPQSSHFFTAFPDECATVKANPAWTYESDAFYVQLPDSLGQCPSGTMPIYRSYNGGQDGAPAHRFTPYPYDSCGYFQPTCVREGPGPGVAFCAPVFLELSEQRTRELMGGTWEFSYEYDGVPQLVRASFSNLVAREPATLPPPGWWPFRPYVVYSGQDTAGWDPIAGKITALLDAGVFQFDFDGGDAVAGCMFLIEGDPMMENIRTPCHPMTARRR